MADDLSGNIQVHDLARIKRAFTRSFKIAQPAADTGVGSAVDLDARVAADMALVLHADAQAIGDTSSLRSRAGAQLDAIGAVEGVPRPPAVGASGYIIVSAGLGGSTIYQGDELTYAPTTARYIVTTTKLYAPASQCAVVGLDTGPDTDLPAGAVLEWTNPRPGCNSTAVVWDDGLTGGRNAASDDEYVAKIIERRKNPPAAGNDAAYQALVEDPFAHGVAVLKSFTWPACLGSGAVGFGFLLRPAIPGGSRIPSAAQLEIVGAACEGSFPADDDQFAITIAEQAATVAFQVAWRKSAAGWANDSPWPEYVASTPVAVSNAVAITSAGFRIVTIGVVSAPLPGKVIALYDASGPAFRRKTIATVTEVVAEKQYDLTFDMTAGAPDAFVPTAGALVSPWSDSLDLAVPAATGYFDGMGPGEMVPTFYDPGRRQRRQPENPEEWPSEIGPRLDALVQAVSAVRSGTLVIPASTSITQIGINGALAYVRRLTDLAFYGQE